MKVRKYNAKTSRDALRQVREDLGPDAVILANRMVRGGVEILAMPAAEAAQGQAAARALLAGEPVPLEVTEADVVHLGAQARSEPQSALRRGLGIEPQSALRRELGIEPQSALRREPGIEPQSALRRELGIEPQSALRRELGIEPQSALRRELGIEPQSALRRELGIDPQPALRREPRISAEALAGMEFKLAGRIEPRIDAPRDAQPDFLLGSALEPRRQTRLGLRAEPSIQLDRTPTAPQQPAILRRRQGALAAAGAPPAAAQRARERLALADSSGQLDRLASVNDPLMAALAEEVKSLGSMLVRGDRAARPVASPPASEFAALSRRFDALAAAQPSAELKAVESNRVAGSSDDWMKNMMGELRSMRLLIEDQMGAIGVTDSARLLPGKARVARILSSAGFSAPLIRKVTARLPDHVAEAEALAFVRTALGNNLAVAGSEVELLERGGVFALVGPTGAGKTTTAAKLAARFVVRHGSENLALLTTDGYRIGGQEQLRIYGKILGVAVHAVKDAEDLKRTLAELRNRKLVLIDTVGLSQRDRMVSEQHAMFADCGVAVKRLLLLNATCHGETLNDVVRAYQGDGLAGCILTKLDEAAALGASIDTAIRARLRVYYAADGQRVPEDLHVADAQGLIDTALRLAQDPAAGGAAELDFALDLPPAQGLVTARVAVSESGVLHG